ncbi:hypothetical protein [Paenibacillus oleatilyticus]|uniref:Butirosin biosynthesis protein H N-terminal domain-containing protein n=1 Tax=Paenibacillus oleatilyticus TaxID=2594886 RepID=A0ABV4VA48_9BACL
MNDALFHNVRYNCIHVTIAAMLRKLRYDVDLLFNQAGLYYDNRLEKNQQFFLDPYFRNVFEHIRNLFGVQIIAEHYDDLQLYLNRLEDLLFSGRTVGIFTDAFSLDYCKLYETMHFLHSFELASCGEGLFEVHDHFYMHQEHMTRHKMAQVLEDFRKGLSDQFTLYYIDPDSKIDTNEHRYMETLRSNYLIMTGERCYIFKDTPQYPGTIGLKAIEESGEHLMQILDRLQEDRPKTHISHVYTCLTEVANSRHNYHVYLKKFGEDHLAELYLSAHQGWMVYANLFMRATLYPGIDMKQRLRQRILAITEAEQMIVSCVGQLLHQK